MTEQQIEQSLIEKLIDLKYIHRPDIRDREALERNFRAHFETLNRVNLTDGEFLRLLDEIVSPDVFASAKTLRERNSFTRDDGTPLNYTLVNIRDWCKNNQDVKALCPKVGVDGLFLAFSLLGNKQRLLQMVDISGHGTGKLNTDQLEAFELASPQPAEQHRIANCFTSLDSLIAAQAQKLDALRTHKKGLMQQLFPSPEVS